MRLGILGGTFDPPHIGHLVLAEMAREALALERILFVPAGDPPHKDATRLSIEHRLTMLERSIASNARFAISRVDIDRPGPHYSVDMVRLIQLQHPDAELFFLIGADSLRDLPTWHRPQELIQICRLVVMPRAGVEISPEMHEDIIPGLTAHVVEIDAPMVDISSTEISARLRAGKSVRYLVPQPALDYIVAHGLYADE